MDKAKAGAQLGSYGNDPRKTQTRVTAPEVVTKAKFWMQLCGRANGSLQLEYEILEKEKNPQILV